MDCLFEEVENNNFARVEELVQQEANVYLIHKIKNMTVLHEALLLGRLTIATFLLSFYERDLNVIKMTGADYENRSIWIAHTKQQKNAIKITMNSNSLNDQHFDPSRHEIVLLQDPNQSEVSFIEFTDFTFHLKQDLAQNGLLDINAATNEGKRFLHLAAMLGDVDLFRRIIDLKADILTCDHFGDNCLNYAIKYGHSNIVEEILLLNRIKVFDLPNNSTYLQLAATCGHVNIFDTILNSLIHIEVDRTSQNLDFTVIEKVVERIFRNYKNASSCYTPEMAVHISKLDTKYNNDKLIDLAMVSAIKSDNSTLVENLISKGADIFKIYPDSNVNAIYFAAQKGATKSFKSIVSHSMEYPHVDTLRDHNSLKSLHLAIAAKNNEIAHALLDLGVDPEFPVDDNGYNALHCAVVNNNVELVKTLIKRKVNLKAKCKYGDTALEIARGYGLADVVYELEDTDELQRHKADAMRY